MALQLEDSDVEGALPRPSKETNISAGEKDPPPPLATYHETFSFGAGRRKKLCLAFGVPCAVASGCIFPTMAFFFAQVFEKLGADSSSEDFLDNIRTMAYTFMILGACAFIFMTGQNTLLEVAAGEMTISMKTSWFDALLRQDLAYYDIKDVSGTASMLTSNAAKYRRGIGRKLGEGIQFTVTLLGGLVYAFYASWRTSLIILAMVPVMAISSVFLLKMNQSQTTSRNESYAEAGSIVYATVSAIRTVLSLNACDTQIDKFAVATEAAYYATVSRLPLVGLSNGTVMGSFLLAYVALTLYGSYLLYDAVRDTGCDPSGTVEGNDTCSVSAMDVFGALMGVSFAAMGLPQVSVAFEALTGARAACYPAIVAMNRKVGHDTDDERLPEYIIDSSSDDGMKPLSVEGVVEFREISFAYPTRMEDPIFNGMSLRIEAGKTVALVGPSGGGKSTTVQLLERFYDVLQGSITIDGNDIRELNVKWLRQQIGLVSQEPTLFARSIRENISYGCPGVTQEEIEEAARMANAHEFISSFPDGYDTQVGDKGAQLSGGQKQRIAIARVLVKNPKILLLDEATSALDSESERVVQNALDDLLVSNNRTTIVIAHRLSTIRNADLIAVVEGGKVVEQGDHKTLMAIEGGHYRKLTEAQSSPPEESLSSSRASSRHSSFAEDVDTAQTGGGYETPQLVLRNVHFCYPTRPENLIFRGLSLEVMRGETLALVGPSGGGKSTTVQLIERFYDPTSGCVELDGVNLKDLNVRWLRDQLGLVSQEPTLFNTSIAENIKYGCPDATQEQVEVAARQANAHDFISSFPFGYDTYVGERGTQVSGGQKQRIAIARAILKKPSILLLDEATSALDNESERIVQEALDQLMSSKSQTTIVIAHRLSTIRNADRIAVIAGGKVREIGTHDELMANPSGQYRRLQNFQCLGGDTAVASTSPEVQPSIEEKKEKEFDEEDDQNDDSSFEGNFSDKQSAQRARLLAKDDIGLFFIGAIGACLAGLVFPAWGIIFAYMIELLYKPVIECDPPEFPAVPPYESCDDYWESVASDMQDQSFKITYGWMGVIAATMIGNMLLFFGFGKASEKMNKRVRDAAFIALVRQEISFFDKRTVGSITSQLQDDAAMIHSFSGEPIRTLIMNLSSVLVGLIVSFVYMWPFAALTLAILPFMGFGAEVEMRMYMGEDIGASEQQDSEHSPGGIAVESLLNIRTVASLTIEGMRSEEYSEALKSEDPTPVKTNFLKGMTAGLGQFIQQWGMALMFFWGGWLLYTYPNQYSYRDYLISMFALLFSLSGTAAATQGTTDREKAKGAANRIFSLMDRKSAIDPLSDEGKKGL